MKRSMLYRAFLAFRLTLGLVVLYASLPAAVRGEIAGSLLVYGTGVFFVMLHGAAESSPSPQRS